MFWHDRLLVCCLLYTYSCRMKWLPQNPPTNSLRYALESVSSTTRTLMAGLETWGSFSSKRELNMCWTLGFHLCHLNPPRLWKRKPTKAQVWCSRCPNVSCYPIWNRRSKFTMKRWKHLTYTSNSMSYSERKPEMRGMTQFVLSLNASWGMDMLQAHMSSKW